MSGQGTKCGAADLLVEPSLRGGDFAIYLVQRGLCPVVLLFQKALHRLHLGTHTVLDRLSLARYHFLDLGTDPIPGLLCLLKLA